MISKKEDLRLILAEASEFGRQFATHFWLDFVEGRPHLVLLLLLDLAEGRYRTLRDLVRVLDLVLELLVDRTQIRLVVRLCALLSSAGGETQRLLFRVSTVYLGHKRRWQRWFPLFSTPGHG